MTEEQQARVLKTDKATLLILNGMIAFLEQKKLAERGEITDFLRKHVETLTMDATTREAAVEGIETLRHEAF